VTVPKCQELCPFFNECVDENVGYLTRPCTDRVEHLNPLYFKPKEFVDKWLNEPGQARRRLLEKARKHKTILERIGLWELKKYTDWVKRIREIENGLPKGGYLSE
jgi:hypothetical protein